jgi:hypothetical protein
MLPPKAPGGTRSTSSEWAGASATSPKCGRTGISISRRMSKFFSTVSGSTGTPG